MTPISPREISPRRLRHAFFTLLAVTAVCGGMLLARFAFAGTTRFYGLFGNLLLAWIPLVLALLIRRFPATARRGWWWAAVIAWILFFPNAYYIVTDLIHTRKFGLDGIYRWFDMTMTAGFAWAGIFLGSLALYLMHLLVRRRYGWRKGWAFAVGVLALGAYGIYLGRILRLNSWDVVVQPWKLFRQLSRLLDPETMQEAAAFSVTFFVFSLAVYAFFVSTGRLHEKESAGGAEPPGKLPPEADPR